MLCRSVQELIHKTPIVRLASFSEKFGREIYLKLEAHNPGGSMKDRSALFAISNAEQRGELRPGSTIIESTSGSMGVALAMIGRQRGYNVVCVVDPKLTTANRNLLQAFGARIDEVNVADTGGSYLPARISRVQQLLATVPSSWWLNQYNNFDAREVHVQHTAPEIVEDLQGSVDWVVCPISTGGLVGGMIEYFKKRVRSVTKIIGVDAIGSVTLGGAPGPRAQTGVGSAQRSRFFEISDIDIPVHVADDAAFSAAAELARTEGIAAGCSTGTALAGLVQSIDRTQPDATIVIVGPDSGLKYLDTVFSREWVKDHAVRGESHGS